ncbi:Clp protease N-terminal domain-containing protein [Brevibacterium aurantiacum]|uniref:Clp protease N-terminal domain-containing protein n=1 Tax=Brevibacterium aurantiacum TaxID=273384 RepID=UPI000FCA0406|nr:Clp protease N-terminal domain-containing protein [Brevibacterium aurantiacum]
MSLPSGELQVGRLCIDGWVTPRLEAAIREAAQLANESPGDYLGVEHVMLALIAQGDSPTLVDRVVPVETVREWRDELSKVIASTKPEIASDSINVSVERE